MATISNETNQNHKDSITYVISKISYYKLNLIIRKQIQIDTEVQKKPDNLFQTEIN